MKRIISCLFIIFSTAAFGQSKSWYPLNSYGSFGASLNFSEAFVPGISFSSGMGIGKKFSAGASIDFLWISSTKKIYSPVALNIRYYSNNDKNLQPYLSLGGGYSFYRVAETLLGGGGRRITSGGGYLAPGIGLNFRNLQKNNVGPYIQLGFKTIPFRTRTYLNNKVIDSYKNVNGAVSLDIGIRI